MKYNSSEQAISWFRERYMDGSLTIKPPYKRKLVWTERQKCYLIESILMGLPIPEIYVQRCVDADGKNTFAIVDGQQRIHAILQYLGAETESVEDAFNCFPLDRLDATSPWAGKSFQDLTAEERIAFFAYRLAVRYLDTDNEGEIRDLFARLNKYLTPLKPQELRNATYQGPFVRVATAYADNEFWAENRIVTADAIRRMADIEFISELLIGLLHGPQGGTTESINEYYAQYEDYEDEFPDQKPLMKLFDETLRVVQESLPHIKDTRWSNKTDFYSLFVALGSVLRGKKPALAFFKDLRHRLEKFADEIDRVKTNENAKLSEGVHRYVEAIERGANDKSRRAVRHAVIVDLIEPLLTKKKLAS